MNLVAESASQTYSPSTPQANKAARDFVHTANTWAERHRQAQADLKNFVEAQVGHKPRGYVSRDALGMSAFALMFDKAPGAGFIAVPGAVADDLRAQGLRGYGYFPDTNHPLGKAVLARLTHVSRVAEQRPLLNGVPGVASVAIEGNRLVMTRAEQKADGSIVVKAGKSAVSADAQLTMLASSSTKAKAEEASVSRARPRM